VFPITVSGVNVTPGHKDQKSYSQKVCTCPGVPPTAGIPITFWEPAMLIDVTRHAYKLLGLGGVSLSHENFKNRGSVGAVGAGGLKSSFYHVHLYRYPIFALLNLLTDFGKCTEKKDIDIAYMSELDPLWPDDRWALATNPEAGFFGSTLAQTACFADCTASSAGRPLDKLFWCAGCEGSLFPFTGNVAHHVGGIQASALLVYRLLAKLHRGRALKGQKEDNFCKEKDMPIIKKSLYKTQLVYPIPQTKGPCHPLGKSDLLWGAGKSYPHGGEDFVYLIWKKKQCCLDAVKPAMASGGGL
ncbi:MAG: TraU family protein, partial [Waddliaceae bacterium]